MGTTWVLATPARPIAAARPTAARPTAAVLVGRRWRRRREDGGCDGGGAVGHMPHVIMQRAATELQKPALLPGLSAQPAHVTITMSIAM